jgi:hypothetical protein
VDLTETFLAVLKDLRSRQPNKSQKLRRNFLDKKAYNKGLIAELAYMMRKVMGVRRKENVEGGAW